MARHVLPHGRLVIDGIAALGDALEYDCEKEYTVGRYAKAAVDLAWFRAGDQRIPLMIFEVESRASSSMANNAVKVFSHDTEDFVKPLFFFHLLLAGGPDNERISALRKTWGTYNYRVYRLNSKTENQRLVIDVLGQHRRVSQLLSLIPLAAVLRHPPWSDVNIAEICQTAEHLQFSANYRRELALLATEEPLVRSFFAERLCEQYTGGKECSGRYGTYIGSACSPLLELCFLIGEDRLPEERGTELLATWQAGSWGMSQVGPHFGLSRDYDVFILTTAPMVFAAAAALCGNKVIAKTWIADQLSALIKGEESEGVHEIYIIAAQQWLSCISASILANHSHDPPDSSAENITQIYDQARAAVSTSEGPDSFTNSPPSPFRLLSILEGFASDELPPEDHLPTRPYDVFNLAVAMLTEDYWMAWPTDYVISLLRDKKSPESTASDAT